MTENSPIIISGVDVSNCENYNPKGRFTCNPHICNCHQKPNCYFKQLARKEQECEAKTLEFEGIKKQLDQLKAENEQLKEKIENYCFDCDVAEKMREVVYAATGGRLSYANYTVEAIEQAYNDQLLIDVGYRTEELEEQLKQAEQKLERIKDIANTIINGYHFTNDIVGHFKELVKMILQIIDEVKYE